jgi:hypothetical protein
MINNTTDLESFTKELQAINSEYFIWLRGSGQGIVGNNYCPPPVYVLTSNGKYSPAKVRLDHTLGILIEPKEK